LACYICLRGRCDLGLYRFASLFFDICDPQRFDSLLSKPYLDSYFDYFAIIFCIFYQLFFFYACGGHGNRSLQRSAGGGWKRWLRAGRKGETRALRRPHTTCVETPVENSQGSWEGASVTNEYTTCRQATHTLCAAASMWTDWPPRAHQCRDAVLTCIVTGGGWREGREERAIAPNPCTSPRPCL
jgi:hypothetical protein